MKKILLFTAMCCLLLLSGCNSKTSIENTLKAHTWVCTKDVYNSEGERVKETRTLIFEANTRGYDQIETYFYDYNEKTKGKWGLHYYISGDDINCVYDVDPEAGTSAWPSTRRLTYHKTYLTDQDGNKFEMK